MTWDNGSNYCVPLQLLRGCGSVGVSARGRRLPASNHVDAGDGVPAMGMVSLAWGWCRGGGEGVPARGVRVSRPWGWCPGHGDGVPAMGMASLPWGCCGRQGAGVPDCGLVALLRGWSARHGEGECGWLQDTARGMQ